MTARIAIPLILLGQGLDLAFTLLTIHFGSGPSGERMFLAASLLATFGAWGLLGMKVVGTSLLIALAWLIARQDRRYGRMAWLIASLVSYWALIVSVAGSAWLTFHR